MAFPASDIADADACHAALARGGAAGVGRVDIVDRRTARSRRSRRRRAGAGGASVRSRRRARPAGFRRHAHASRQGPHLAAPAEPRRHLDRRADRGARRTAKRNWAADDVERRMDFALRCAYAHGTAAIRTHLDCAPPQHEITLGRVRSGCASSWAGRIELQAVLDRRARHLRRSRRRSTPSRSACKAAGGILGGSIARPSRGARGDASPSSRRPASSASTSTSTSTRRSTRRRRRCAISPTR